jgi:hypothetical protein
MPEIQGELMMTFEVREWQGLDQGFGICAFTVV